MTIDPSHLLKKLEPAVRPAGAPGARHVPQAPLEQQSFDELLQLVSTGSISSGRPVSLGASLPDEEELDEAALRRLAAAADLAEASGARRAVMLLDGRGLVMDVASRAVIAELSANASHRLVDIDAAVYVAGDDDAPVEPMPGQPDAGRIPAAVLEQIEAARRGRSGSDEPQTETRRPEARKAS